MQTVSFTYKALDGQFPSKTILEMLSTLPTHDITKIHVGKESISFSASLPDSEDEHCHVNCLVIQAALKSASKVLNEEYRYRFTRQSDDRIECDKIVTIRNGNMETGE